MMNKKKRIMKVVVRGLRQNKFSSQKHIQKSKKTIGIHKCVLKYVLERLNCLHILIVCF